MYLSRERILNAGKYKYQSICLSKLSNDVLAPYIWKPFLNIIPLIVAPNIITATGLLIILLNGIDVVLNSPTLTEHLASWHYFTWAACLFLYQALDAVDGLQARRTGSSSPLGQILDHGVDSIVLTVQTMLLASALQLGPGILTLLSQITSSLAFFVSNWEERHTSIFILGPVNGPVEGLLIICAIFIISGIYGPQIWDYTFFEILNITIDLRFCVLSIGAILVALTIYESIRRTYNLLKKEKKSTMPATTDLASYLLYQAIVLLITYKHPIILDSYNIEFVSLNGIVFAYTMLHIIVSHVFCFDYSKWNFLYMVLTCLLILPERFVVDNKERIVYVALAFSAGVYMSNVKNLVVSLEENFGIYWWSTKRRKENRKIIK